ncbi:MAG: endonuclease/exonuclease/phosphatase family protein [Candidatus Rokubacteria bacterium]|nr:endonuclease/exonuclease/phosphatase family protein [Candidatus Rokubacteria bacterium]
MRLIAWNIRAGGGRRVDAILGQLERWTPDVVALSEFRATEPSVTLARGLTAHGLAYQLTSASSRTPNVNALLVASRWPLRRVRMSCAPADCRWLLTEVEAPEPFAVGAMHVPNRVSGRKYPFLDAVLEVARRWRRGPALLAGDTNSGRRDIDEESPAFNIREESWIDALAACGWADAFRALSGQQRAYTWYSPNGRNGFRIDQAFVNAALRDRLSTARYVWARTGRGGRQDAISDHAALVVDLALARAAGTPPLMNARKPLAKAPSATLEVTSTVREETSA